MAFQQYQFLFFALSIWMTVSNKHFLQTLTPHTCNCANTGFENKNIFLSKFLKIITLIFLFEIASRHFIRQHCVHWTRITRQKKDFWYGSLLFVSFIVQHFTAQNVGKFTWVRGLIALLKTKRCRWGRDKRGIKYKKIFRNKKLF